MSRQEAQLMELAQIINPIDINAAAPTSDIVELKKYDHVMILLNIGNLGGDTTLTVEECDNNTPDNATAIAFNYRKKAVAGQLGALTAVESTGLSILEASDDNYLFVVELDAADLTDGYPGVRIKLSDPSAASVVSATAVLTRARYVKDAVPVATG